MSALDDCYNIFDLRDAAKRKLPKAMFEFVDRSTEDEIALRNNRAAFEKIRLRHRALVDVSGRSTKTTLFGKEISAPMAIAPTGAAGLCWYEGELELAKAAAKMKIPFTLATGAMTSMEKIAKEANFRLWFQLYVWKQRDLSYQLIERAKNNGFEALIVTTDTIVPPNREYNAKNGLDLPFTPTLRFTRDIMLRPGWFTNVLLKYLTTIGMPRNENYPEPYRRKVGADPYRHRGDAPGLAQLGRHQDLPGYVAGNFDAERHQPSRRRVESGQRRRRWHRRVEPRRPQHGQRRRDDRHAAGNRRGGRR